MVWSRPRKFPPKSTLARRWKSAQAVAETNDEGEVKVFLNSTANPHDPRTKTDRPTPRPCSAPRPNLATMPISARPLAASVVVTAGQAVKEGDLLLTIEANEMETGIHAERYATVVPSTWWRQSD
jgi:pyruvate carboxylase